jgi:hypothetical protein
MLQLNIFLIEQKFCKLQPLYKFYLSHLILREIICTFGFMIT